jgi:hypothetical protein
MRPPSDLFGRSSASSLFRRKTSTSSSIDSHYGFIAPQIPADVKKFHRWANTAREEKQLPITIQQFVCYTAAGIRIFTPKPRGSRTNAKGTRSTANRTGLKMVRDPDQTQS